MDQDHIDSLLERYLHLLHEYTSLREELAALQTGMYQNIARANFAAERGVRFGQDYYDDRMQASRRLAIAYSSQVGASTKESSESQSGRHPVVLDDSVASFTVVNPTAIWPPASDVEGPEATGEDINSHPVHRPGAGDDGSIEQSATKSTNTESHNAPMPLPEVDVNVQPWNHTKTTASLTAVAGKQATTLKMPSDPLRWYGLLTPMSLRQAQTQSIRAVEHVIPRLVSLDVEMAGVEIEVRRARKRRAKAEAAAGKNSQ
ncbi:hypothetical protein F5B22DRAFT_165396 [Xylaria bambusicola]|uniref:uncharacterized protein n=1 Tax=Xylaria bambusicola TaxID=326684 RepID=UPI0020081F95|nr:uncharacterized protein F5B22DRAFT_165396 [Xylaria bambusicola]KAI0526557.1 hypothetical protein F5B22DRAFT_165396 [Xylaria bambusicola]